MPTGIYKRTEDHRKKLSEAKKGRKRSLETKKKISMSSIGKKMSLEARKKMSFAKQNMSTETKFRISEGHKGQMPWNIGLTKETDERIKKYGMIGGETRKLLGTHRLEKHPSWHGGISFEPYGKEFNKSLRRQIRKRDNYTCQECHYTEERLGYTLTIHHIDYDKKNNKKSNLISVCKSCNSKANFDRNDWKRYYQEIMREINDENIQSSDSKSK